METKISFYNILNMFLIGLIFFGCIVIIFFNPIFNLLKILTIINIGYETLITIIFFGIIYEVGLIINRISSVIIEEFLKKTKLIVFRDYALYKKAETKIDFIKILSREYALSRNSMTLFFILCLISIFSSKWIFFLIFLGLTLLFFLSLKKHVKKILILVDSCNNK
jgi:hypothetical protein